jgi:hypothetical protein
MTHKPFLKLVVILGCRAGASIVLPALLGQSERLLKWRSASVATSKSGLPNRPNGRCVAERAKIMARRKRNAAKGRIRFKLVGSCSTGGPPDIPLLGLISFS